MKLFKNYRHLCIVAILVVAACSQAAQASLTFAYEGVINHVDVPDPANRPAFDPFMGQTLHLEFTFDESPTTNPDTDPLGRLGSYSLTSLTITLGGNTYTAGDGKINTQDGFFGDDAFDAYSDTSFGLTGPSIGGMPVALAALTLWDTSDTAVPSAALPLTQPDPADFPAQHLRLAFGPVGSPTASLGADDNITIVPEPATMSMLAIGGLALIRRRRSA